MSTLNEPVAKRIAKLFRLLASDFDGEVLNAARRMKQQLAAEGLSFNDIATVIENANGEIEETKYSDTDAEIIFTRGVEKGRAEEARKQQAAAGILRRRRTSALERDRVVLPEKHHAIARRVGTNFHQRHGRERR